MLYIQQSVHAGRPVIAPVSREEGEKEQEGRQAVEMERERVYRDRVAVNEQEDPRDRRRRAHSLADRSK